jgi:hypothetical protein
MFKQPPHRVIERSKYKAQKKAEASLYDHPQQPTDVVTGCAQHGVNPVTGFTLQMAPIHSVIMLHAHFGDRDRRVRDRDRGSHLRRVARI